MLAVAVLCLLMGWFPQASLRRLVETRLRETLGAEVRLGHLHVTPLRLTAVLGDLHIKGPTFELTARQGRIGLSWGELVRLRMRRLSSLSLDRPFISLTLEPSDGGARASYPLPAVGMVSITDGTFAMAWKDRPRRLTLEGLEVRGGIAEGALSVGMTKASWADPRPVDAGPIRGQFRWLGPSRLRIDSLEAHRQGSRLDLSGELQLPPDLQGHVSYVARLDLMEAEGIWRTLRPDAEPIGLRGAIGASGDVEIAPSKTAITARLQSDGFAAGSLAFQSLEGTFAHDGATRADLLLKGLGGQTSIRFVQRGHSTEGEITAEGLDLRRLAEASGEGGGPLKGSMSVHLTAKGEWSHGLSVAGSMKLDGAYGSNPFAATATTSGMLDSNAVIDVSWSTVVTSQPRLSSGPTHASFQAEGTARGPWPPHVSGTLSGETTTETRGQTLAWAHEGRLSYAAKHSQVDVRTVGQGGTLDLHAETQGGRWQARLQGDGIDVGMLSPEWQGSASLDLEARGSGSRYTVTGHATAADAGWKDTPLGEVQLSLSATDRSTQLALEMPDLGLTGDGTMGLRGETISGTTSLADTPLEALGELSPSLRVVSGSVSGELSFVIPRKDPKRGHLTAEISKLDVLAHDVSLRAGKPFRLEADKDHVVIHDMRVVGSGLDATVSGTIGLEDPLPLSLETEARLDLQELGRRRPEWQLQGQADVEAAISGTPSRPDVQGFARIGDASGQVPRLGAVRSAELGLAFEGTTIRVLPSELETAGSVVHVEGTLPVASFLSRARAGSHLGRSEEAALDLSWHDLDLARLAPSVKPDRAGPMEGRVSGNLELRGGLLALSEMRGRLSLEPSGVKLGEVPLTIAPVLVTLENGRATTDGIRAEAAGGTLTVQGAVDLGKRAVDVTSAGSLDLRALSPMMVDTAFAGQATIDLAVKGSIDAPEPRGRLEMTNASIRMRDIPQALTDIQGTVLFENRSFRIDSLSALLGGGRVTVTGGGDVAPGASSQMALAIEGKDMAIEYPKGLRSRLDAELALEGTWGHLLLSGGVRAFAGRYSLDIVLEDALRAVPVASTESAVLRGIGLDLRVETVSPVHVVNNQVELEVGGFVSLRGSMETPAPFGRMDIQEGGRVYWQGREFRTRNGSLSYEGSWDPTLSLSAEASIPWQEGGSTVQDVRVTVEAKGALNAPSLTFSSQPYHSQMEILNLITTGEIRRDVRLSTGGWVVGEQAAALLAGHLSRKASRSLSKIGVDEVAIQPELVARETDPGARFTFGKRINEKTKLIYSSSLKNAEERFVQLSYTPGRRVLGTVQRRDDGTFSYGLGQRGSWFGPTKEKTRETRVRLRTLRIEGGAPFSEAELRGWLRVKPGKHASAFDLQDRAQALRKRFQKNRFLEAEVSVRWNETDATAVFRVDPGARYRWQVVGASEPAGLEKALRSTLFEEEALDKGRTHLLKALYAQGFLRAAVKGEVRREPMEKVLVFNVETGSKLQLASVEFPGASAVSTSTLLKAGGGPAQFLADPLKARAEVAKAYRQRHYLKARVDPIELTETADAIRLRVPVDEGPRARVASLRVEVAPSAETTGAVKTLTEAELQRLTRIQPGKTYAAEQLTEGVRLLRDHYFSQGCLEVRLAPKLVPNDADYDVVMNVVQGNCLVLGTVKVEGLTRTRESLVRRQVRMKRGEPLDPRELARMEQRLLALGVFSKTGSSLSHENPATLTIQLEEDAQLFGGYAVRYYDDRGIDYQLDSELRNLLGYGLAVGATYRYSKEIEERRGSLHFPSLPLAGDFTLSVSRLREVLPQDNRRISWELRAQQTKKLPNRWDLLLGYRYRRVNFAATDIGNFVNDLSGLDLSLIRETRDNFLSPRRGSFSSVSVSYSPRFLGGDLRFIKGFAQASIARSLRSTVVWAQGYRVGLAHGFEGQQLDCTERFSAGGANSLRGYATNSVGPFDPICGSRGNALLVVNQELRYTHRSGLGGAVFYDVGNVFGNVSNIDLSLRHSMGVGLRWDSPIGLLRLDVGIPLDRRAGDGSRHFFFSLGQAF